MRLSILTGDGRLCKRQLGPSGVGRRVCVCVRWDVDGDLECTSSSIDSSPVARKAMAGAKGRGVSSSWVWSCLVLPCLVSFRRRSGWLSQCRVSCVVVVSPGNDWARVAAVFFFFVCGTGTSVSTSLSIG